MLLRSFFTSSGVAKYTLIEVDSQSVLRITGEIFPVRAKQKFPILEKRLNKFKCWSTNGRVGERNRIFDFFHLNKISIQTSNTVYAIDQDKNATELTENNATRFRVKDKIKIIEGLAQDILPTLPKVDAIVVGGTTGDTEKIIKFAIDKLNKGGRLVITSILIETIYNTLKTLQNSELIEIDIIQVTVAKSRKTSTGTMMISRNPVIIFSATK